MERDKKGGEYGHVYIYNGYELHYLIMHIGIVIHKTWSEMA